MTLQDIEEKRQLRIMHEQLAASYYRTRCNCKSCLHGSVHGCKSQGCTCCPCALGAKKRQRLHAFEAIEEGIRKSLKELEKM